ncbi:MAG: flagellin [Clostridiales bacterium]|nr:flagellin [Clostridiales bacterium]
MRIQHNIMAMNAYRNYTNNVSAMKKNLEKLSSGYKINRAGDDAAGLAISEKMRAQITGLETAQKNAKDGISLVQTAEGAMTEVHDMLNRMVELATQSANGTYDNETDRYQLQKEMDQLRAEINRIADSSNFNGIKLLDGSMEDKIAVSAEQNLTVTHVLDGKEGAKETLGEFKLDLSQATWTNTKTNAAANITMKLGDVDLKLNGTNTTLAVGAGNTVTGKDVADAIYDNLATTGEWTDKEGNEYTVTNDGNGVLTFTQKKGADLTAGTALDFKPATDAEYTPGATPTLGIKYNQGSVQAITVTKNGASAGDRLYAQGKFNLTADHVKDGGTLTIGDTTYVFAVGKNSKYADQANVIDLTDLTADSDDLLTEAAQRLSAVAEGNKNFFVETDAKTATVYLTEKEGGVDYSVNKLGGTDGKGKYDNGNAVAQNSDWNGLVKYGSIDVDKSTKALTLQIGDTADSYNQLKVSIGDIHTKALGLDSISIADQDSAAAAVDAIKAAINKVSDIRGTLGATQNRLDHTINNLSVMTENIQDAESTIRDVDVAEEMMAYTKNNILIQSAQAMLAQANQVPQGVLQLLQ